MRDRMLAGDLYLADDPELQEAMLRAMDLMDAFNATSARNPQEQRRLLTELLGAVGEDTYIRPPLRVDYGRHLRIGARTFANFGLVALDVADITIGDDVQIGTNVQLLTPTPPGRPGTTPAEVGGRPAHRHRRQRLARQRRHRAPRRHDRRQHRGRGRRRGHPGPARERSRGRQPGPGRPDYRAGGRVKKLIKLPSGSRNSRARLPHGMVVGALTKSATTPFKSS
jgi:hypothetical protein